MDGAREVDVGHASERERGGTASVSAPPLVTRRALAGQLVRDVLPGGKGLFIGLETRPLHANEGNQKTRMGTSP